MVLELIEKRGEDREGGLEDARDGGDTVHEEGVTEVLLDGACDELLAGLQHGSRVVKQRLYELEAQRLRLHVQRVRRSPADR